MIERGGIPQLFIFTEYLFSDVIQRCFIVTGEKVIERYLPCLSLYSSLQTTFAYCHARHR